MYMHLHYLCVHSGCTHLPMLLHVELCIVHAVNTLVAVHSGGVAVEVLVFLMKFYEKILLLKL